MIISHFDLDPEKFQSLRECTENYEVGDSDAEWPNNILSRRTVVYGSGVIARKGTPVKHNVASEELALCRQIASEACALMKGITVGMGSEADDTFHEFFISANIDDPVSDRIDEALIWSRFGGTIFPPATISVEPLVEGGIWWSELFAEDELEMDELQEDLKAWRRLMKWFANAPQLKDTAFVRIGDYKDLNLNRDLQNHFPAGTEMAGCVLPRLVLGLTHAGSLAGLFGYSVQT